MQIFCRYGCAVLLAVATPLLLSARELRAQQPAAPSTAEQPAGNAANGKRIYTKYGCYECHGR